MIPANGSIELPIWALAMFIILPSAVTGLSSWLIARGNHRRQERSQLRERERAAATTLSRAVTHYLTDTENWDGKDPARIEAGTLAIVKIADEILDDLPKKVEPVTATIQACFTTSIAWREICDAVVVSDEDKREFASIIFFNLVESHGALLEARMKTKVVPQEFVELASRPMEYIDRYKGNLFDEADAIIADMKRGTSKDNVPQEVAESEQKAIIDRIARLMGSTRIQGTSTGNSDRQDQPHE
ncbi:hypothetical protein G1H11_11085 [Phytoactinopolyspora alkaliphila]|uniref:DUF4760 domain-containing protein n=1 Tax=Phytoactinopolyspora alkaliphila TaxID=1783498 RepID=A0A6N9YLL6_9ACTN|nr:hypothetical protein [Phytoactinopolyspora alkaliphila]NED95855.1 hypothetical protein [Phytoactinopolyspora alkaliphila]